MKKILLFLLVYIVSVPTLRAGSGWGWLGVPLAIGATAAIVHASHDRDYYDNYYDDEQPVYYEPEYQD